MQPLRFLPAGVGVGHLRLLLPWDPHDAFDHLRATQLAHEVQVREMAFDHVRIGVDHRMIELGADLAAWEAFE